MSDLPQRPPGSRCIDRLKRRGRRDRFLRLRDQSPRLDAELEKLGERLEQINHELEQRLTDAASSLRTELDKVSRDLDLARDALERAFVEVEATAGTSRKELTRMTATIDHQSRVLGRLTRMRMQRVLERTAPQQGFIRVELHQAQRERKAVAEGATEAYTLLRATHGDTEVPPGASIFELGCEHRLEQLCRPAWLARLRLAWLKRGLRQQFRAVKVFLSDIALEHLVADSRLLIEQLVTRHDATHDAIRGQLTDAWRGIRYNLSTAMAEIVDLQESFEVGSDAKRAAKMVELRGLLTGMQEHAKQRIEEAAVTYASILGGITLELRAADEHALQAIGDAVTNSGTWRGRLRWTAKAIRNQMRRAGKRLAAAVNASASMLREATAAAYERAEIRLEDVLVRAGLRTYEDEQRLALADLPSHRDLMEQSRVLPPVYRRLFSDEPVYTREFLVGRDDELQLLAEVTERWRACRATTLAIVGPKGSGKTSLINVFREELDAQIPVAKITLDRRLRSAADLIEVVARAGEFDESIPSVDRLIQLLLERPRTVIIIEEGHLMHLRVPGAGRALTSLLRLLTATRSHHLWIYTCRHNPWRRMGYLYQIDKYFTHVIATKLQDMAEIKATILTRQRATGDVPVFAFEGFTNRRMRRLMLDHSEDSAVMQQALEEHYFEMLYALSGGDVSAALYYWLQSLHRDDGGRLVVKPLARLDDRFIKSIERPNLYTLAEILGHGCLTPAEHGEIFRMDLQASRLMLEHLRQLSLLRASGEDETGASVGYSVSPVFYQSINNVLVNQHMLY